MKFLRWVNYVVRYPRELYPTMAVLQCIERRGGRDVQILGERGLVVWESSMTCCCCERTWKLG